MRVLDPCSGSRMMWFDRAHPDVIFGDRRSETLTITDRSHGRTDGTRTLRIEPDVMLDFRALPYADNLFKWNETQVKLREVLELSPHQPLFGNTSGKKAGTHWLVFMKPAHI